MVEKIQGCGIVNKVGHETSFNYYNGLHLNLTKGTVRIHGLWEGMFGFVNK